MIHNHLGLIDYGVNVFSKSTVYTLNIIHFLITGENQQPSALPVTDDQKAKGVPAIFGQV